MLKKPTPKNILTFLGLISCLVWLAVWQFPDNKLHIIFCDVGQGDATLITKGFNQILIDAGPNDKVLTCLKNNLPFWDKKIEITILTHPEADHMTGFISILDKHDIGYFLIGPETGNSAVYEELLTVISGKFLVIPTERAESERVEESLRKTRRDPSPPIRRVGMTRRKVRVVLCSVSC